jgi:hypothetical protein
MQLLTQNSDLKKSGIYSWTLPAHTTSAALSDGRKINTCPNAGICAAFCYAKQGTYMFKNVKAAHLEKLELCVNRPDQWIELMNAELAKKKYLGRYIRVHDAGDFFSKEYTLNWFKIMNANPDVNFYAYTKEVQLFKFDLKDIIPDNFTIVYSYGGRQDNLIDRDNDRHSDVFGNYEEMIKQGYSDAVDQDDKLAAYGDNKKVGLFRNNIRHFVKKMGDKFDKE